MRASTEDQDKFVSATAGGATGARWLFSGLLVAAALAGCTSNPELAGQAFVAPGRYALYDCQQLAREKTSVSKREAELRLLIDKAQTGFGGPLIAETAYGSDYATERQKLQAINQAEVQNRCGEGGR